MRVSIKRLVVLLVVVALLSAVALVPGIGAQDDDMMKVACDSDLILSLYIAEYYFGFGAVQMMADDMMMVDVSNIDKGQFAPLFDSMMGMMDDMMMMPGTMMDEAMMNSVMEMMSSDMMMGDDMMDDMMLSPVMVAGEPEECTALRDELRRFYTAIAYTNLDMMMDEGM